ncbi:MAG: hypothetical protein M3160_02805 [Candidatus Eremiobacteraeota bacterium]|nr:hypothetical protein [Candidatus Eremiobacteraeota bacterium]
MFVMWLIEARMMTATRTPAPVIAVGTPVLRGSIIELQRTISLARVAYFIQQDNTGEAAWHWCDEENAGE